MGRDRNSMVKLTCTPRAWGSKSSSTSFSSRQSLSQRKSGWACSRTCSWSVPCWPAPSQPASSADRAFGVDFAVITIFIVFVIMRLAVLRTVFVVCSQLLRGDRCKYIKTIKSRPGKEARWFFFLLDLATVCDGVGDHLGHFVQFCCPQYKFTIVGRVLKMFRL